MTDHVTIRLPAGLARTMRNVLRTRAAQLEHHMKQHGEAMDAAEHQLSRDVQRDVAELLALVEAELQERA